MVTAQLVIALFLLAQIWDGLFTYVAVERFGIIAEGNPVIAAWIALAGPQWAIAGAKLLASACGMLLYCLGLHRVLSVLTLLYGVGAVGPWLLVFRHL